MHSNHKNINKLQINSKNKKIKTCLGEKYIGVYHPAINMLKIRRVVVRITNVSYYMNMGVNLIR